ncbi:hypothetical protein ACP70R_007692 [Stipagrostis hirtigluma subsp. patula]
MPSSSSSDESDRRSSRKRKHAPASSAPPAAVRHSASTIAADMETGSHVLTVRGYSGIRGLGVGNGIRSVTFAAGGHRWFIRLYPDGFNADCAGWVSVVLHLDHRRGAGDDDVSVNARFEFGLLDQVTGEPAPSRTMVSPTQTFSSTGNLSWGYYQFVTAKDLESSRGLMDGDAFRIRCEVTVVTVRAEHAPAPPPPFPAAAAAAAAADPSPDLHRHLGILLATGLEADVAFNVAGEKLRAHRVVLAARSLVFREKLLGSLRDAEDQIEVDGVEPTVFRAMLRFVYTDTVPEMDDEADNGGDKRVMAQRLLVAADRFRLQRLKLICEDVLCSFVDASTAATFMVLAEQRGCRRLKEGCFEFLRSPGNMKAVMESDGFDHLMSSCPSLVKELLLAKMAP